MDRQSTSSTPREHHLGSLFTTVSNMRLAQLHRPLVAASSCGSAAAKSGVALRQLQDGLAALRIGNTNQAVEGRRYASVKSQGAYRIRDSSTIPKNLGAKKTGGTYQLVNSSLDARRGSDADDSAQQIHT